MKTAFFFLALLLCSCRSIVETEAEGSGGAGGAVPGGGETGSDEAGPGTAGGAVASGGAGAGASGDTAAGGTGAGGDTAAGGDGGAGGDTAAGGDGGAGGGTCEWQGTFTVCFEPCGCELSPEEMNTRCEEDAPGFGHAIVCTSQPIPSTQMPFKACQTMSQAMTCSGAAYEWYCCQP